MNWLVYIAAFFVFVSYWMIPKKPLWGWFWGVVGNGLYIVAFLPLHRAELEIAPVGFTLLSAYNLWRALNKPTLL